jgi:hypothetical protein
VAVWAGLLVVALAERAPSARLLLAVGALGAAAVLTRQLTALWVVLAVALCALAARPGRVREVLRLPAAWATAAAMVLAVLLQGAWLSWSGLLGIGPDPRAAVDAPAHEVWRTVAGQAWDNVTEMIGVFGWLDAPAPSAVWMAWLLLVGGLALAAMLLGRARTAAAVVLAVVLTWALSLVLEVQRVASQGYWWQGRYSLPFAVGIPLLAAAGLATDLAEREKARRRELDEEPSAVVRLGRLGESRLALVVGTVVTLGQALAFAAALQRYMVGRSGPLLFFRDPAWAPPVPALLLLAALGLATAALCWWLLAPASPLHAGQRSGAPPATLPAVERHSPPVVSAAEP